MGRNGYANVKITVGTAFFALFAFIVEIDCLTVINTCGNFYVYLALTANSAFSVATCARFFNYLARTTASVAGAG